MGLNELNSLQASLWKPTGSSHWQYNPDGSGRVTYADGTSEQWS
ncbi:hypothetical protein [Thalassomonas haliotis]|nr:hypothetical protein [Thalassomonas haliotis]